MTKSKVFHYLTDNVVIMLLAFIGGFVDAAGYIKLFNLFTSSITGNLVVACTSLYHPEGVLCRFFVSLCFAGGAGIMTTLSTQLKVVRDMNPRLVAVVLFCCELAMFIASWIVGHALNQEIDNGSLVTGAVILLGSMLGFTMGCHNGAAKETIPNCPSTTVMTMTLVAMSGSASTSFNLFLSKYGLITMHPKGQTVATFKVDDKLAESMDKLMVSLRPLITFLIGALVGASTMHSIGFHCLFIPVIVVIVFILDLTAGYYSTLKPTEVVEKKPVADVESGVKEIEMSGTTVATPSGSEYARIDGNTAVPSATAV